MLSVIQESFSRGERELEQNVLKDHRKSSHLVA